jgi:tetratricopeptide (TPR) repeat protein
MAKLATAQASQAGGSIEEALNLHREGRLDAAEQIYAAVLAADPHNFSALHLSGLVKYQQGRFAEALRLVAAALEAKPISTDALLDYGAILEALDRSEEALATFDRLLPLRPDDAVLHYNRGNAQKHLGRYADAVASYDRALALAPGLSVALHNRGSALAELGRDDEAVACFQQMLALASQPSERIEALSNRGKLLTRLKRYDAALADCDALLTLRPDDAPALSRRGLALTGLGRYVESLAQLDQALRIAPDLLDAHLNRGNALIALNRMDEALRSFTAALAIDPQDPNARFNEALTRLCLGDFREGWKKYEHRWDTKEYAAARPKYPRPMWRGEGTLQGKVVLLCAEQGLGDAIQFVRYVPHVAALGAKVVLGVHPPLTALFASVAGVSQVIADGGALPDFDLYCPLLSLPLAFGTELTTIPASVPYLRPDAGRIVKWQGRMPQSGRLRIGICWAGTSLHPNNHNRSLSLRHFAKLLSVSGIDFVSLQKDVTAADAAILSAHGVTQLGREFEDFADTAAVIAMLDLVICVDTSVAHLAGAMGKATGVLIPFSPDFRWMCHRSDSPWYPTMRLFRQSAIGDWDTPLDRLHQELLAIAHRPTSAC